jgi:hypothetical protein
MTTGLPLTLALRHSGHSHAAERKGHNNAKNSDRVAVNTVMFDVGHTAQSACMFQLEGNR